MRWTAVLLLCLTEIGWGEPTPAKRLLPVTEGLVAWYDAEDVLHIDDKKAKVAKWPDVEGTRPPARAWSEKFQPTAITVPSPKGRRVVVRFDGVDDFLSAEGPESATGLTVFMVVAPQSNAGEFQALISGSDGISNDYQFGFNADLGSSPSSAWNVLNVEGRGASGGEDLLAAEFPFGSFHLLSFRFDAGKGVEARLDGKPAGSRDWNGEPLALRQLFLGARTYRNEAGPAYLHGFGEIDLAEVIVFARSLEDIERDRVEQYLSDKHGELGKAQTEPPVPMRMLVPGFESTKLPLEITNINDLAYDDRGRLWLLAYDGRVLIARDTNNDGLEDAVQVFWDKPTIRAPLAMLLRPDGVYVSSIGKISKIEDTDGDDKGDKETVISSDWAPPPNFSGGVDALGMAIGPDGNIYFSLGCADFTNPYLLKDGKSDFSLTSERGTVLKVTPSGERSIVATGVRFGIALAFNRAGDLFATDQEGESWLPGGNPLDELLHIRQGRHYGFPPKDPRYLPDVFDEPAVATYGPQHQSTCGLTFNDAAPDRSSFGPAFWEGDAIISGFSRGKVWRTKLAKSDAGYVSTTQLIAISRALVIDAIVAPSGDLIVATHSGDPDWGKGPTGPGTLWRIKQTDKERPLPVSVWPASPVELHVTFDHPIEAEAWNQIEIEHGEYVRAGDEFEYLRPGYESVRNQFLAAREPVKVHDVRRADDGRTLILRTDPHPHRSHYAFMMTNRDHAGRRIDLEYDLSGISARLEGAPGTVWLPHLDEVVARAFLKPASGEHERFFASLDAGSACTLQTMVEPFLGSGNLVLSAARSFKVTTPAETITSAANDQGRHQASVPIKESTPIVVHLSAGSSAPGLSTSFVADASPIPRPIPLAALQLPWSQPRPASAEPSAPKEIDTLDGDWYRGREIFYSTSAQCGNCHRIGGKGGTVGPDLSNLVHRDAGSVRRDIAEPSAAINPDFIPLTLLLTNGEVVTGLVRPRGTEELVVVDATAKERVIAAGDIDEYQSSQTSIMPTGIVDKIGAEGMTHLLTYLTQAEPALPESAEGKKPPTRTRTEVDRVLSAVEVPKETLPLNIVLLAGPQDHGPGEHDYPRWQRRWSSLLTRSPGVKVSIANDWPTKEQFDLADVLVCYFWNHDWSRERYADLERYFARGGGMAVIHAATIADTEPEALAEWIGLAFLPGKSKYRHGPLTLEPTRLESPITAGMGPMDYLDETYWPMFGEVSRCRVLATAKEKSQDWPIIWTYERDKGRVFASILGHYSWTFDDPLFRAILLRGIAWAASQPEGRLQPLATEGWTEP